MKEYISATEIQDLNRYVETLPISLNTYKYLKEENYLIVSEYVQLSSKQENLIMFNITKNNTFFKIYLENDDIVMNIQEMSTK